MPKKLAFFILFILSALSYGQSVISEEIVVRNGIFKLPGTLSYTGDNRPLIIWIHGSGPSDRDGNQAQFIKQFRAAICVHNLSFFSFDKRTSVPENLELIKKDTIIFNNLIDDAKSVVEHFKKDNRFKEIILIGHSQGSLIALKAQDKVDKIISLSGTSESIDKTLVTQITNQNEALGNTAKKHLEELKNTGKIKEINPFLLSLFSEQNQKFLSSWMAIDPIAEIKKVTIPLLILNGDKDLQVPIEHAKKLKEAKKDAELKIIKHMNHVLKHIEKDEDNMASYYNPDFPISKELVSSIVEFVNKN